VRRNLKSFPIPDDFANFPAEDPGQLGLMGKRDDNPARKAQIGEVLLRLPGSVPIKREIPCAVQTQPVGSSQLRPGIFGPYVGALGRRGGGEHSTYYIFLESLDQRISKVQEPWGRLQTSFESGKPVFPLRIDRAEPPGAMKFDLPSVHWLDVVSGPEEEHFEALASSLGTVLSVAESVSGAERIFEAPLTQKQSVVGGSKEPASKPEPRPVQITAPLVDESELPNIP
jgi:hypothetical protein